MNNNDNLLELIQVQLHQAKQSLCNPKAFCKTGPGQYAEHDQFLGVPVPALRTIAKKYATAPFTIIKTLITSCFNEERLVALLIVIDQYKRGNSQQKEAIYQFYKEHLVYVNNWNLVDSSAHLILGAYLADTNKDELLVLAQSQNLWERRIAIVATWYFIKQNQYEWTITIATILLTDSHDLIHKAVGWMLREVGKKDIKPLQQFLDQHASVMPRTMLRYAIEKFPEHERKMYLSKTTIKF